LNTKEEKMAKVKRIDESALCHVCGDFNRPSLSVEFPENVVDPESSDRKLTICANCLHLMTTVITSGVADTTPPMPKIAAIDNGLPYYGKKH